MILIINANIFINKMVKKIPKKYAKKKLAGEKFYIISTTEKDPISTQRDKNDNLNNLKIKRFRSLIRCPSQRRNNWRFSKQYLWMSTYTVNIKNTLERFENEIKEYASYLSTGSKNTAQRKRIDIVYYIRDLFKKLGIKANIEIYGSFKQRISTVFSDIGLELIMNDNYIKTISEKEI